MFLDIDQSHNQHLNLSFAESICSHLPNVLITPNIYLIYENIGLIRMSNTSLNRDYITKYIEPVFGNVLESDCEMLDMVKSCFSKGYSKNCVINLNNSLHNSFNHYLNKCRRDIFNPVYNFLIITREGTRIIRNSKLLIEELIKNNYTYNIVNSTYLSNNNICDIINKFLKSEVVVGAYGADIIYAYLSKRNVITLSSKELLIDNFYKQLNNYVPIIQKDIGVESFQNQKCKGTDWFEVHRCYDLILNKSSITKIIEFYNMHKDKKSNGDDYYREESKLETTCGLNGNLMYINQ